MTLRKEMPSEEEMEQERCFTSVGVSHLEHITKGAYNQALDDIKERLEKLPKTDYDGFLVKCVMKTDIDQLIQEISSEK